MAKSKSAKRDTAGQIAKQPLHGIKNGSVQKNKNSKSPFKNIPMNKAALIDSRKVQMKTTSPQKKDAGAKNNQNSPKKNAGQLNKKQNSPKGKQNSLKGKQNSPNRPHNEQAKKKINLELKKEVDDSNSDIDEEMMEKNVSLMSKDEKESDTDVPDIFGTSLADESDEDDEDFESEEEEEDDQEEEEEEEDDENDDDDEDDEEETVVHKGVKMFKGIKSKAGDQSMEAEDDDDDDDDDEDDEEEDDDEDESNENINMSKISLSGIEDDEDDDDDDEDEEEDDDEDESNENINMSKTSLSGIEDDEDDDDDDEDDDEDEEDEEENDEILNAEILDKIKKKELGLKALLGKTITDDEDDEDFNEEEEDDEDDDISDEDEDDEEKDNAVKVKKEKATKVSDGKNVSEDKKTLPSPEERAEINKKTIFIDNIPIDTKEAAVRKVFAQFGPINSIRFRSIVPRHKNVSKKVAAITNDIHPEARTVVAYVYYKSQESAEKAVLGMNGKVFQRNYVNVKIVGKIPKEYDHKKAIFIGNLKHGLDTNVIWKRFGECGEIDSVRLFRDGKTGKTRGFGYVNFKSEDSVALALKLDGTEILKRPVRVQRYLAKVDKNQKAKKRVHPSESERAPKKFKNNSQEVVARPAQSTANVKKQQKKAQKGNTSPEEKNSKSFQGQQANLKNKKKKHHFNKKKALTEKLTTQYKKSTTA